MPSAWFGGVLADDLLDASDDLAVLDRGGWWAVVLTFEGEVRLWRFGRRRRRPRPAPATAWPGVAGPWTSSLDEPAYREGVSRIRETPSR